MVSIPPFPADVEDLDAANILHDEVPAGIPPTELGGMTRYKLPFAEPELWDRIDWTAEQLQVKMSLSEKPTITRWYVPVVTGPGGRLRGQARAVFTTPQGFSLEVLPYDLMRFPDVILYAAQRGQRPGWEPATDIQPGPTYPGFLARNTPKGKAIGEAWLDHPFAKQGRAIFRDLEGAEKVIPVGAQIRLSDGVYVKFFTMSGSWLLGASAPRVYFWERIGR